MITDEMLAQAAEEVSLSMADSLDVTPHRFSSGFERKMRSVRRRAEHPVRYQVLRHAAAVLVAVITAFAALYAFSPTVQAAVNGWVRTAFGSYFQYSPSDTTPPDVEYDYYLPEEFDGYTLTEEIGDDGSKLYVYTNKDGDLLFLEYILGSSGVSTYLMDIENHQYIRTFVDSQPADLYIALTEDQASVIKWQNREENVLLSITAMENEEQLIAFAKKVEKIPKN